MDSKTYAMWADEEWSAAQMEKNPGVKATQMLCALDYARAADLFAEFESAGFENIDPRRVYLAAGGVGQTGASAPRKRG